MSWLAALLLGTVTAVGGGMMRDLFLRQIPRIFGGNTLYATSALLASGVMVILYKVGYLSIGLILATLTGAALTFWHCGAAGSYRRRMCRIRSMYPPPAAAAPNPSERQAQSAPA